MGDRVVAEGVGVGDVMHLQGDERVGEAALAPADQSVAADEIALVGVDEAVEPGFVGGILDRQLGADHAVALLDAQRVHGADAERLQAEVADPPPSRHRKYGSGTRCGWCSSQPSSPTKLTRSALARCEADLDRLAGQPGEGGVGEVGRADPLHQRPRLGAGHHQHAHLVGQIVEADRAVGRHVAPDPVVVEALVQAGRDQIEAFGTLAHDGELGMHPAPRVERVAEMDPADLLGHPVGDQTVEKGLGARSRKTRLGEGGHVEQANVLSDVAAFVADVLEPA